MKPLAISLATTFCSITGSFPIAFSTLALMRPSPLTALHSGWSTTTQPLNLRARKTYDWSVISQGGQTTLRISADGADVENVTAPADIVKGIGFASTVRHKGDESDITITIIESTAAPK